MGNFSLNACNTYPQLKRYNNYFNKSVNISQSVISPSYLVGGGTENARMEKAGRSKMQGWKTRHWKMWDQNYTGGKLRKRRVYGQLNVSVSVVVQMQHSRGEW